MAASRWRNAGIVKQLLLAWLMNVRTKPVSSSVSIGR
jgi:hypothetical protein